MIPSTSGRSNASVHRGALAIISLLMVTRSALAAPARFTRFSVQDGLSQSSVETIGEDRYGFLWFGTQEGLNRFDGQQFVVHQESPLPGRLADSFIRAIVPDEKGDLWIGSVTALQHLDVARDRFEPSVTTRNTGVRLNALVVAPGGRLWFGGQSGGLWMLPPGGREALPITTGSIEPSTNIRALLMTDPRTLWIACDERVVEAKLSPDGAAIESVTVPLPAIGVPRAMYLDSSGALWIGREKRPPLRFDPSRNEAVEMAQLPPYVLTITGGGDGSLWFGGRGAGVTRFDPSTGATETFRHEPGDEESLAENDVAALHRDRGGNLWAGAWNGGLSRFNLFAQAFHTLRNDPAQPGSLPDDDVVKLAESPSGALWTISRNNVLSSGDPNTGLFERVPFEGDLTAISFAGPRLFLGTRSGIVELDEKTRLRLRGASVNPVLDRASIDAIEGTNRTLWVVAEQTLWKMPMDHSAPGQSVALPLAGQPAALVAHDDDTLWIVFSEGIVLRVDTRADGRQVLHRIEGATLTSHGSLTTAAEWRGALWIGSARGLCRMNIDDEHLVWTDIASDMPSRSIAGILGDDRGLLWIATNLGITRYDWARGRATQFGAVQGAQGSGYVDGGVARGRATPFFYFAGRGITRFDPHAVRDNPYRPPVAFTSLEILHHPVVPSWLDAKSPLATGLHAAREVTLGPEAVVFSVEMAAPGASDPAHVVFEHRLDGFDRDWVVSNAQRRVATYTSLSPGLYVLRARARAGAGAPSSSETTLRIRMLPPWWRTRGAIALWIVLGAALIAALVVEIRRRERMRVALAEQEVLRRASVTDPLTGLYNRRFLSEWMRHEVARVQRSHRNRERERQYLLLAIVDVDGLKEINDIHGHDAGDRSIVAVASMMRSQLREEDLAVRWGGDEFVFVSRMTENDTLEASVERMHAAIADLELGLGLDWVLHVSIGFARYPFLDDDPEGLTVEQTMQIADLALLRCKRRGRNTWTGYVPRPEATAAKILSRLRNTVAQTDDVFVEVRRETAGGQLSSTSV